MADKNGIDDVKDSLRGLVDTTPIIAPARAMEKVGTMAQDAYDSADKAANQAVAAVKRTASSAADWVQKNVLLPGAAAKPTRGDIDLPKDKPRSKKH